MANITTQLNLIDNMSPKIRTINNGLGGLNASMININSTLSVFNALERYLSRIVSVVNDYTDAFANQFEQEQKLYTIMQQRMNATKEEFLAMKQLASQIQANGVLNDQVILKGAQELASFVKTEDEIKRLLPAIANLTVQQYGYNASADQMRQITTSIGKMLNGTVSGLSKLGLAFTDEEKKMLKSNDMAKKVEIVYQRIVDKVGNMNLAMSKTNVGRIMNLKNQIQDVNEELGRLMQPLKIVGLEIKLAFQQTVLKMFSRTLETVGKQSWWLTGIIAALGAVIGGALTLAIVKATSSLIIMLSTINPILGLLALVGGVAGAIGGAGLGNKINKMIKETTTGFQEGWADVAKAADGSVLVTDRNLIDIADDYRELLSRRATQLFNLQMAEGRPVNPPNITIEHVDVHKEADAESVLQTLADSLDSFSQSSLAYGGGGGRTW